MFNYIRRIIVCSLMLTILSGFGLPISVQAKDNKVNKEVSSQDRKNVKAESLKVISTDPKEDDNVPINKEIRIKFNKPIDSIWNSEKKARNKGIILRSNSGRDIPLTFSINNDILIIRPEVELKHKSKYELIVTHDAVHGTDKTKLKDNFRLVFTTERSQINIVSVSDIASTVNQGDNYSLPKTVMATMSDGTYKGVYVIWNPTAPNTSNPGVYKFNGTVEGYQSMVTLTLTVIAKDIIRPKYVNNTFKLYKDSTGIRAEFDFDQVLVRFKYSDFSIAGSMVSGGGTYVAPDSGYISGKKVVLNFNEKSKREFIMALGGNAKLHTRPQTESANMSGITIAPIDGVQVWDDRIAPEWTTVEDNKYVLVAIHIEDLGVAGVPCVALKFTEALDSTISGLYKDDFIFIQDGKFLTAENVIVDGQYLKYFFKPDSGIVVDVNKRLLVKARTTVDIRDRADSGAQDYNYYVPKADDINGRY